MAAVWRARVTRVLPQPEASERRGRSALLCRSALLGRFDVCVIFFDIIKRLSYYG